MRCVLLFVYYFIVIGRNLVRSSSRYTVRQESLTLRQLSLHHGLKVKKPKPKVKKYKSSLVDMLFVFN